MTLTPLNIPHLLKKYNLKPRKSLGQNFLIDPNALMRVVEAAQLKPNQHVLEIGAGLGSLTRLLARHAHQVIAIEIDRHLIPILQEVLVECENVRIIQGDILELTPEKIFEKPDYIVVANIPYYITSALLRHLLESSLKPRRMVLTIQSEVAERICARSGKMSLLALSVQVYGEPNIAESIPAECFYPVPEVDSSVLVVELYPEPIISTHELDTFFTLAHAGFHQKRKTLRNALSSRLPITPEQTSQLLMEADINPQRRAETLTLVEWSKLTGVYMNRVTNASKNGVNG